MADGRHRIELRPGQRPSPRHRARASICCLAAAPTINGPASGPRSRTVRSRTGLNAATKYVATHRPESLEWGPVGDLGADIMEGIRDIKSKDGPDLIVWGSSTLTSVLLEQGLVDEVVLIVYPVLLGRGKRFFSDSADPQELAFVSTKATPTGVLLNTLSVRWAAGGTTMKEAGTPTIVSREEWERARANRLSARRNILKPAMRWRRLGRRKPGRGYGDANRDAARFNIPTDSDGDPAGPGACLDRLLT